MAKQKNKPQTKAKTPEVPPSAPTEEVTTATVEEVAHVEKVEEKINPAKVKGLSQDSKVLYADLLQRRYIEHPANGVKYQETFLDGVNMLIDATIMSVAVDEVVAGDSSLSLLIKKTPDAYARLTSMAQGMGINIPALNLLPTPTKEELKDAGVENNTEELAVIKIEKKNISKDTRDVVKKELKLQEQNVELDPTKIEKEEDMAKSAEYIITSRKGNVYDNLIAGINFYRSWLLVRAQKIEDEAARKKEVETINGLEPKDLLLRLSELIGGCPFIMRGLGHYMTTLTSVSKNPVSAFCTFRNVTKNKTTGIPSIDDPTIASLVTTIIVWATKQRIVEQKKNLKVLETDKEANKEAIEKANANIEYLNNVIESVLHPDFSIVDNFIAKYEEKDDQACKMFNAICDSYYKDIDIRTVNQAQLKANVQQYAGVIMNMFAGSGAQSMAYTEANISELTPTVTSEAKKEEESKK